MITSDSPQGYIIFQDYLPPIQKKIKRTKKKKKHKKQQQTNKNNKQTNEKKWIPFKSELRPLRLQMNSFIKIKSPKQVKFDISTKK